MPAYSLKFLWKVSQWYYTKQQAEFWIISLWSTKVKAPMTLIKEAYTKNK